MKRFLRRNLVIVLAFLIPIAFIVAIALITYLPPLFISTDYDFVYVLCDDDSYYYRHDCGSYLQSRYEVIDGSLVIYDIGATQDVDNDEVYSSRLFLHNTDSNESREISADEAAKFELSELLTSPDGVTVSSEYDRGNDYFLFFDGGYSYGYYLTKGKNRSKLNLINSDDRYYYRDGFKFVGWVLPDSN